MQRAEAASRLSREGDGSVGADASARESLATTARHNGANESQAVWRTHVKLGKSECSSDCVLEQHSRIAHNKLVDLSYTRCTSRQSVALAPRRSHTSQSHSSTSHTQRGGVSVLVVCHRLSIAQASRGQSCVCVARKRTTTCCGAKDEEHLVFGQRTHLANSEPLVTDALPAAGNDSRSELLPPSARYTNE